MPRYDKTGPDGKGSRTGRGQGDCKPDSKNDSRSSSTTRLGRRALTSTRRPRRGRS